MKFETTYTSDNQSLLEQFTEAQRYHPYIMDAAEKYNLQPSLIAGLGSRESHWGLDLKPKGPKGTGDFRERRCPTEYRSGPLPAVGGFGRGLLQIDFDAHEFARGDMWKDPLENILYGCKVLAQCMGIIKRKVAVGQIVIDATGKTAGQTSTQLASIPAEKIATGQTSTPLTLITAGQIATDLSDQEILRAALAGYNAGPGRVLKAIKEGKDIDHYTTGRDYSADVLNRAGWFQTYGWA